MQITTVFVYYQIAVKSNSPLPSCQTDYILP